MAVSTQLKRTRANCASPWSAWSVIASNSYVEEEEMPLIKSGGVTPGWRRMANRGLILPVNPYTVQRSVKTRTPTVGLVSQIVGGCSTADTKNEPGYYYPGNEAVGFTPYVPTSGDISAAVNSAISDSSAGIMQAAVTAIEARQTFSLLLNGARHLLNLWRIIIADARRRGVSPASLWLEYRYGWLPLVMDIRSAVEALNSTYNVGDRQHGSGRRSFSSTQTATDVTTSATLRKTVVRTLESNVTVNGFALSQLEFPTIGKYGLNPLTTFWETVRLSFIVDWIWDIGSWLAANSVVASGYKLVSSGYSIKSVTTATVSLEYTGVGTTTGSFPGQVFRQRTESFSRNPGGGGGLPSFNFHLSPIHLADLAAIITQMARLR